ncbi:hypothetical protein GRJ2_002254700 [Grus japonensis]|uniref:Uncharacterized protein n=1 Tax=Grus japonensis TaxID=30415 RepID=A0ABC9XJM0_GRUJA
MDKSWSDKASKIANVSCTHRCQSLFIDSKESFGDNTTSTDRYEDGSKGQGPGRPMEECNIAMQCEDTV